MAYTPNEKKSEPHLWSKAFFSIDRLLPQTTTVAPISSHKKNASDHTEARIFSIEKMLQTTDVLIFFHRNKMPQTTAEVLIFFNKKYSLDHN